MSWARRDIGQVLGLLMLAVGCAAAYAAAYLAWLAICAEVQEARIGHSGRIHEKSHALAHMDPTQTHQPELHRLNICNERGCRWMPVSRMSWEAHELGDYYEGNDNDRRRTE